MNPRSASSPSATEPAAPTRIAVGKLARIPRCTMSELQLLRRVELPVAAGLLLAGVRTAAVQVVATASLGAVISADCLGYFVLKGIAIQDRPQIFAGALMIAALSLLTELLFGWLQRHVMSPGLRRAQTAPTIAQTGVWTPS